MRVIYHDLTYTTQGFIVSHPTKIPICGKRNITDNTWSVELLCYDVSIGNCDYYAKRGSTNYRAIIKLSPKLIDQRKPWFCRGGVSCSGVKFMPFVQSKTSLKLAMCKLETPGWTLFWSGVCGCRTRLKIPFEPAFCERFEMYPTVGIVTDVEVRS